MLVALAEQALFLTLAFALYGIAAAAWGARQGRAPAAPGGATSTDTDGGDRGEAWVRSAERSVYAVCALLSVAMAGLTWAMLTDRFDLAFVAQNSSVEQPVIFKLAIWGGQAGSLLLWAWVLSGMAALATWQNRARNRELVPWVIVMLLANIVFFAALVAFVSNPFEPLPPARAFSNGAGMNPLLQHPVMLVHPIVLYLGFIGFAVPFAFAFAALVTGKLDVTWFQSTRKWTIAAWFFLGCGVLLGGRWAYEVLGWGGYWAWDPVENASLMPWLVGTAFVHSVIIQEKRGMLKIWNFALIGLTYVLCVFGTFLTRSGVVQSVHSFANAGWFGQLFLGYVAVLLVVFAIALIWRVPQLRSATRIASLASREASFLVNNYLFLALLGIVFVGTLYPVLSEVIGVRTQFGPPWFRRWTGPVASVLLFLTGVGPLVAWRRATWVNLRKSFLWPSIAAVAVGALSWFVLLPWLGGGRQVYPSLFLALCAFVTATITEEYARGIRARMRRGESPPVAFWRLIQRNQRRYGGYIVHLAVVLMFVGFAGAAFNLEETRLLAPGETWRLGRWELDYRQTRPVKHAHYAGAVARIGLKRDGEPFGVLEPEKRMYFQQEQPASIPAVASTLRDDFYVILVGIEDDQSAALKVYINPLVNWIWIGSWVFVIGNALVLWPVRSRATPPRSEAAPAAVAAR